MSKISQCAFLLSLKSLAGFFGLGLFLWELLPKSYFRRVLLTRGYLPGIIARELEFTYNFQIKEFYPTLKL